MRYFSTFSGIGGFEVGIDNAFTALRWATVRNEGDTRIQYHHSDVPQGPRQWGPPVCVGYSEIDRFASSVYQLHFRGVRNYGDITKINADELPDFDCLVGGFPCQAFSLAGKHRGFDDTRGTLFFDLARILRAKQPRLFVFENVKGLLSHDGGNTFRTIIATLTELGYDVQWQVLNSKHFGVPQNRDRIIIVGHLRGTPRPEVFPLIRADGGTDEEVASRRVLNELTLNRHEQDRIYGIDSLSPSLNTMQGGGRQPKVLIPEGSRARRLTPLECERLQGFPDGWTAYGSMGPMTRGMTIISDTQRYKMCGNAVTTNVIQAVFERILQTDTSL